MAEGLMAALNGRVIPKEDKVFGINTKAVEAAREKGAENVVNATIGALMDDEGKLIVLSSVDQVFRSLEAREYAAYAPIGGTPGFKQAAIKAAMGGYELPGKFIEAVATMGGTGAIKNTVSNYSSPGEAILTTDWCWGPYKTIASEIGRSVETFSLFDDGGRFNELALREKTEQLLKTQERLIIILNTPAHNPTGYSLSTEDWEKVVDALKDIGSDKKVALLVDAAYIDFAGDEKEVRAFLPILDKLPNNVLPLIAYSMSKTFTLYGMRCGALICLAPTADIAEEFVKVNEFSCRGSWSNPTRAAQSMIEKIYGDSALLDKVSEERREIREMLLARGRAFEEGAGEAGLKIVPFSAGFFVSVPVEDPEGVANNLMGEDIYTIPLTKGIRISVSAVPESVCRTLPAKIKAAME